MSQPTTSTELEKFGKQLLGRRFHGVFPLNITPTYSSSNFAFTMNTDTSNLPGTHWIAVLVRDNVGYVFNTFGLPPPLKLKNWLNQHCHKWSCNTRIIQSYTSNLCGYFCLHFMYFAFMPYLQNVLFSDIVNLLYPVKFSLRIYEITILEFSKRIE